MNRHPIYKETMQLMRLVPLHCSLKVSGTTLCSIYFTQEPHQCSISHTGVYKQAEGELYYDYVTSCLQINHVNWISVDK